MRQLAVTERRIVNEGEPEHEPWPLDPRDPDVMP
ncbi:hypothetical protein EV646_114190 [Kribbella antiqua]|uniref:Uncharacterized protein n=1 Tax=Kribbella antiqua TaxID=2512217 RepID=A0A4R2IDW3_9ACTN|nr:hypothetical protein EV646_114190 [Kribbella antiqua]